MTELTTVVFLSRHPEGGRITGRDMFVNIFQVNYTLQN